MSEFKPGDMVCLKSGGPLMTVEVVGVYDGREMRAVAVRWFGHDHAGPFCATFAPECLELAVPPRAQANAAVKLAG